MRRTTFYASAKYLLKTYEGVRRHFSGDAQFSGGTHIDTGIPALTEEPKMKTETAEQQYEPRELAQFELDNSGGDVVTATNALEALARGNPEVWMSITDSLLRDACYNQITALCRRERRKIWSAPAPDTKSQSNRVVNHAKSILDFPLPGGKRLRDATKEDLSAASSFYQKQAAKMSSISEWLSSVAKRVKKGATVGDCLSEKQLHRMKGDD